MTARLINSLGKLPTPPEGALVPPPDIGTMNPYHLPAEINPFNFAMPSSGNTIGDVSGIFGTPQTGAPGGQTNTANTPMARSQAREAFRQQQRNAKSKKRKRPGAAAAGTSTLGEHGNSNTGFPDGYPGTNGVAGVGPINGPGGGGDGGWRRTR